MKALVGAFNQEKALVGAFSVIVQLHRLIDLRHYQEARQAQPKQRGHGGQLGARGRALLHEVESRQDGDQRQRGAPVALVQLGHGGVGREERVTKLRPTKQFDNMILLLTNLT